MKKTGEVQAGRTPVDDGSEICDAVVGGRAVKASKLDQVKKAEVKEPIDFGNGNLKDLCDVR